MKRTHLWLLLGAWFAVQGFVLAARAQTQIAKLTGSDSGAWDLFGDKVSVSGDTAAVGAPWHMNSRGAVYVYRRGMGGADHWGQVCKLLAPDGVAIDNLGRAVCLDGDTLIAGAYGYPGGGDYGAAYIFRRSSGDPNQWNYVKKLTASDGAPDDLFGFAVALCGDTALVGAYTKNVVGVRSGATYVFERNAGGPDQWGQVKELQPEDAAAYNYFGVAIGLSGDTAIIGAYWQTDLPGRAYIFERNAGGAGNWGQTAEIYDHGLESFAYSVGIDRDTAVVGAYANGVAGAGSGRAYIYQRDQGGPGLWGEVATLAAADAGPMQNLGWSVAVGGSTALAGAPGRASARGATYVFRPDAPNPESWVQTARLLAADGAPNDLFGYSVAISGNVAVMGAQQDDDHGDGSGSAYVFYLGDVSFPPTALDGTVSMTVNSEVTVTLTAYDDGEPNPPGVLSYVITSLPAHGYLTDSNGGPIMATPYTLAGYGAEVVYRPDAFYEGSDSFTFVANDGGTAPEGGDSNTATISITVVHLPQLVYSFPLDTDPGWTTEGQWALGQPTGGGSHTFDPTSGHTGGNVYGYNLNGDYPNRMPQYFLTTTPIDCSRVSGTQLRFYRWLGVEEYDQANIAVSNDGTAWANVWQSIGHTYSDSAWSLQTYDISQIADSQPTVYVRWGMGPSDSSVSYPGWNIDDVEIWGLLPWVPGDLNCDGSVNFGDINPFVLILTNWGAWQIAYPGCPVQNGDINGDGTVNFGDINPFVALLTGSP